MSFETTVAILSLNLTLALANAGQTFKTFPITGATATTPIQVTSPAHGVPPGENVHGVVTGVVGETEANGLWELTVVDPNTFSLATYSAQGIPTNSVGTNAYVSGGQIAVAFPDYRILLGRRRVAMNTSVASPRIVFVPTNGRRWDFVPYGGLGSAPRGQRGSLEQQSEKLQPNLGTKWRTFEVHITGCATDVATGQPDPDFGDFSAVDALESALFAVMFDAITPTRFNWLAEKWPSQMVEAGSMSQRGQKSVHLVEFATPITPTPLSFVPDGTSLVFSVEPVNAASGDITVITVES
jgi:hypothetical protein